MTPTQPIGFDTDDEVNIDNVGDYREIKRHAHRALLAASHCDGSGHPSHSRPFRRQVAGTSSAISPQSSPPGSQLRRDSSGLR